MGVAMISKNAAAFLALTALASIAHTGAAAEPDQERALAPEWRSFAMVDTEQGLSLHKDMYALPLTWSEDYQGQNTEVIFQLSAKLQLFNSRFYVAYSQIAFWQFYNSPESSPFRETNYNPEIFYRISPSNSSLKNWGADLGIEHTSNGKSEPDSRSWNRLYGAAHYRKIGLLLYMKAWYRLKEDECPIGPDGLELEPCRDDSGYDDNPDIVDFMGYTELHLRYRWMRGKRPHEMHLMTRGNLATGKGAVALDYSYPTGTKDLHWFGRIWHGYGENLIDHDRSITRVGAGLVLRRF
jgi:phospholipase A1